MSVAIKKVEGVQSVDVSLNEGTADIKLKDGNKLTVDQVREIIRKNGFTPKESTVSVAGKVIERNGKPALKVPRPDIVLLLTGNAGDLSKSMGKQVLVSGVIAERRSRTSRRPCQ